MPFDQERRPGPGGGTHERAINLPPAILWLIVINVAVQLVRQLLSEALDAASAGFRVGYDSPSQFSREYRRLFGQPSCPFRDAARSWKLQPVRAKPLGVRGRARPSSLARRL